LPEKEEPENPGIQTKEQNPVSWVAFLFQNRLLNVLLFSYIIKNPYHVNQAYRSHVKNTFAGSLAG
jgi:hypothetical protein